MFKIFKSVLLVIWLIDIFNIDFVINGISVAYFLDVTCTFNGWFWCILWLLIPSSDILD